MEDATTPERARDRLNAILIPALVVVTCLLLIAVVVIVKYDRALLRCRNRPDTVFNVHDNTVCQVVSEQQVLNEIADRIGFLAQQGYRVEYPASGYAGQSLVAVPEAHLKALVAVPKARATATVFPEQR